MSYFDRILNDDEDTVSAINKKAEEKQREINLEKETKDLSNALVDCKEFYTIDSCSQITEEEYKEYVKNNPDKFKPAGIDEEIPEDWTTIEMDIEEEPTYTQTNTKTPTADEIIQVKEEPFKGNGFPKGQFNTLFGQEAPIHKLRRTDWMGGESLKYEPHTIVHVELSKEEIDQKMEESFRNKSDEPNKSQEPKSCHYREHILAHPRLLTEDEYLVITNGIFPKQSIERSKVVIEDKYNYFRVIKNHNGRCSEYSKMDDEVEIMCHECNIDFDDFVTKYNKGYFDGKNE